MAKVTDWCYEYGNGVVMDKAKAVEWYTKAAEQGHADAQDNLDDFCNDCPNLYMNVDLALNSWGPSEYNPNRYPGPEL